MNKRSRNALAEIEMDAYVAAVNTHPILMAILQFAVLGTLGEAVARIIITRKIAWPFPAWLTAWKAVVWSILAVCIKYAFVGFQGFVDALVQSPYGLLPDTFMEMGSLPRAFAVSVFMNLQFGPFLVLFHRLLDNLVVREKNWAGLHKGLLSLLWFWIPAHTVTFLLPRPYQIGLAALWSLALGLILGSFNRPRRTA
jgi:hypothetical protein